MFAMEERYEVEAGRMRHIGSVKGVHRDPPRPRREDYSAVRYSSHTSPAVVASGAATVGGAIAGAWLDFCSRWIDAEKTAKAKRPMHDPILIDPDFRPTFRVEVVSRSSPVRLSRERA